MAARKRKFWNQGGIKGLGLDDPPSPTPAPLAGHVTPGPSIATDPPGSENVRPEVLAWLDEPLHFEDIRDAAGEIVGRVGGAMSWSGPPLNATERELITRRLKSAQPSERLDEKA